MSERVDHIASHFKQSAHKQKYFDSALHYLQFDKLLTPQEEELRAQTREFLEKEVRPVINEYVERAEFPDVLVPKLRESKLLHHIYDKPYGKGASVVGIGAMAAEFARVDAGFATFLIVHWGLTSHTIERFGNQKQKDKYLPKLRDLEILGGWGLTEPNYGSDASSLETSAKKVEGGYLINGQKRWIGMANRDFNIIWARNTATKGVEGFIVENNRKGVNVEVIKHKLALRIVQNCQLTYTDVFVPEENKLESVKDFASGVNILLKHSRIFVAWVGLGICLGVYDTIVKYISDRKQFGKPIAGYQLQQERLVRILSMTSAVYSLVLRTSRLIEEGKATIGMIAMTKAFTSEQARQVAKLGREMMGGNGIIHDNYVIKALNDAEVNYTYEGSYDVNSLVTGREITGLSAFK